VTESWMAVELVPVRPPHGLWITCPLCKKREGYVVTTRTGQATREQLEELASLMDGSSPRYAVIDPHSAIGRCEFCNHRPIHVEVVCSGDQRAC
jgi:hypothetical protein